MNRGSRGVSQKIPEKLHAHTVTDDHSEAKLLNGCFLLAVRSSGNRFSVSQGMRTAAENELRLLLLLLARAMSARTCKDRKWDADACECACTLSWRFGLSWCHQRRPTASAMHLAAISASCARIFTERMNALHALYFCALARESLWADANGATSAAVSASCKHIRCAIECASKCSATHDEHGAVSRCDYKQGCFVVEVNVLSETRRARLIARCCVRTS